MNPLPGDLLNASHLEPLALLDDAHEHAGIEQRIVRAGIEPGRAASQALDVQRALREVGAVEVGDLQLPACGRFQ